MWKHAPLVAINSMDKGMEAIMCGLAWRIAREFLFREL